jgi:hypothetical protein
LVNGESDDGGRDELVEFCPQLPPQVRNFSLELLDPLSLPYDELGELLIRRTTVSRHPAMIATFARRSTRHAEDLTSHSRSTYFEWKRPIRSVDWTG